MSSYTISNGIPKSRLAEVLFDFMEILSEEGGNDEQNKMDS